MREMHGAMISIADHRLDVHHSQSDNSAVIVCHGWLDAQTCDGLQELIDAALDERVERLRLDLANLIGLDESGHSCLAKTTQRCEAEGILLEIDASPPILRDIHARSLAADALRRAENR
jgi:anti-anti-sigma regulatory factor